MKSGAYKFTSKKQSKKGIMSTVMAVMSVASFFIANTISFRQKGQIGHRIGAAGFVSLVFAMVGVVLGILSFGEDEVFKLFPWLGLLLSFFDCILWVWIIMIGAV